MSFPFQHPKGCAFVPDGSDLDEALRRTTHLGIGAHPDDLEFMGWHPILECLHHQDNHLTGVITSDGRSSSRSGMYARHSDDEMVQVRLREQQHAAVSGEYAATLSLMYEETGPVMGGQQNEPLILDIMEIIQRTRPRVIFTHNLCDRHPHHVVVVLAVINALRRLNYKPEQFYGGEAWRGLDWMNPSDRMHFDVSEHQNITAALMGVYDSQITGGKRYDQATAGRKRANATYSDPFKADDSSALEYAMDMLPLLHDHQLKPEDYAGQLVQNFLKDVQSRLTSGGKA